MKIFNKGARAFKFHGRDIVPDQFTDLTEIIGGDPKRAEQAAALLKDYPHELLAGDDASASAKAATADNARLSKENATLRAQVDKLQKLLTSTDATAIETALTERAEKAEARVVELEGELALLDEERKGAVKAAYDYQEQVETLTRQVEALTAPAPDASAATEAAPASEPATTGKKNKR